MHAAGDEAVALVSSSCAQGGVEQAIAFQNDQVKQFISLWSSKVLQNSDLHRASSRVLAPLGWILAAFQGHWELSCSAKIRNVLLVTHGGK